MRTVLLLGFSAILVGACAPSATVSAPTSSCAVDSVAVLRDSVAGPFKIGEHADSVRARCDVAADSVRPDPGGSDSNRSLLIRFGSDSALLVVSNDTVFMIRVFSARFQTVEGFAAGRSLGPVLRAAGARASRLHTNVLQINRYCGMDFHFDRWHGNDEFATELSAGHLMMWPEMPAITEVVVHACRSW